MEILLAFVVGFGLGHVIGSRTIVRGILTFHRLQESGELIARLPIQAGKKEKQSGELFH